MSKATIKQLLQSMTKKDIIEMVLDLYSARKEAKEYLDFYACPDEKENLKNIRASSEKNSIHQSDVSLRLVLLSVERLSLISKAKAIRRCPCRTLGILYGMGD